jgi:hypothetical protein
MLFYAQKMPKKDLFAHASQYCSTVGELAQPAQAGQSHPPEFLGNAFLAQK